MGDDDRSSFGPFDRPTDQSARRLSNHRTCVYMYILTSTHQTIHLQHNQQPAKKKARRLARKAKAAAVAPRPTQLLRPVVHAPTQRVRLTIDCVVLYVYIGGWVCVWVDFLWSGSGERAF